ncbi:Uma2 family endonuclease [Roseomonas mucosa]|uniref:Uma2 family endonuclease n=1 Tax=Roseomonas mucosa TaxID=207340 RepID=UPI00324AAA2F
MSQPAAKPWTLEEFLAWEERQPLRYEFDGVQPLAMTGGTAAHAIVQGNLAAAIVARLRGQPCRFIGNDLRIEVAGRIRYPDGFITCAPLAPRDSVAKEPVVVFEVVSTSTARTDRITKLREYQATPRGCCGPG